MWNSNSRRWLVKDKEFINNDTTTNPAIKYKNIHQHTKRKCRNVKSTKKLKLKAAMLTMWARTSHSHTTSSKHVNVTRVRVNPCLNQIIEVLLAILLANCLMNAVSSYMPAATAAFGADVMNEDSYNNNIYSSSRNNSRSSNRSGSSSSSSSNSNSNSNSNSDDGSHRNYYRQPHSIGGSTSAFGYNGLQQPLQIIDDDIQLSPSLSNQLQRSQNFKISPKPCSIGRIEGTCMFVWECIKSEGRHVGMCVDSFMFGSCCVHNYTDNIVMPQAFSYKRPTKPMGISSLNHRPRPPHLPHKPSISGMTTIERPHGAGTLVIRPSGPHHQGALHKPHYTKPPTSTTSTSSSSTSTTEDSNSLWTSNAVINDMQSAASVSAPTSNIWNSLPHQTAPSSSSSLSPSTAVAAQQHWHMTTEPNFITKPRPPIWDKPTSLRPKPSKPTKKPIIPVHHPGFHQHHQTPPSIVYSTRKPMPTTTMTRPKPPQHSQSQQPQQQQYAKPTRPASTTTTMRPYSRPTPSWTISESMPGSLSSSGSSSSSSSSSSTQSIFSTSIQSTTTTQKYRPTSSSSSTTTSTTSSVAAPTKTTQRPQVSHMTPTHTRPSSASSSSPTTTNAAYASTAAHTLPPHNLSTIESNEIIDGSADNIATVKTISAARSECGIPVLARPETRIVGGKNAAFGRWPWQVSVRRTSFFGFSSTHRCGGALINENWIATAGHCVDDLLISQIRIRVGEYDFSHVQEQLPYIERGVAKKVVHPKYNFFTYEYDLALVKLEQPLEFAPHVSPICLPQTDSLLIGMNATVTGWGRLSEGGTLPSVLQEVSVPIVSNDICKSMFLRAGRQEFIPEIFLCAGYETGGQDSCQGDSGGPLQVKSQDGHFFLAGIISWGIGCAEANLPGVCTRISKFVPWILENVT